MTVESTAAEELAEAMSIVKLAVGVGYVPTFAVAVKKL
jgi:hypothetical protein